MALENLTLDTLGDLDNGQARGIVDAAIRAALLDLEDRSSEDAKPRKVIITLTLDRIADSVLCTVEAQAKVPAYKTGGTTGRLTYEGAKVVNGRAVPNIEFRPGSPSNPDQKTFDDLAHEDKE